ncbi:MAG: hypothetical protein HGB12_06340, partial [Bacteroidetes bacterium]|nr:hypothetical protein [Bacteroidota bacterium]
LMSPVINTSGQTTLDLSFKSYISAYSSESSCEVWTTSDGGTTWNPANTGLPWCGVNDLALHPSNTSIIYALGGGVKMGINWFCINHEFL